MTYEMTYFRPEAEQWRGGLVMADCGCGRSPTGQCIGWHALSEEEYQQKLKEHQEKTEQDDAADE